ncbi:Uncharacterised protein [Vibrio cholerae]|nr:Uncharacterised protein [Vibrio cholerae]
MVAKLSKRSSALTSSEVSLLPNESEEESSLWLDALVMPCEIKLTMSKRLMSFFFSR